VVGRREADSSVPSSLLCWRRALLNVSIPNGVTLLHPIFIFSHSGIRCSCSTPKDCRDVKTMSSPHCDQRVRSHMNSNLILLARDDNAYVTDNQILRLLDREILSGKKRNGRILLLASEVLITPVCTYMPPLST
jgi:hypothetical protein